MSVTTTIDDKRLIAAISWGPTDMDAGYAVGVAGVTSIVPYHENGEYAPVVWFAVHIGTEIAARVPARMVMISYQMTGDMQ